MNGRLIWKDITRNRAVTLTILLFVCLAAMLLSLAAILGVSLLGSIDRLMEDAHTPHFMQMHIGELNIEQLDAFATDYDGVTQFQVLNFLGIDSEQILVNGQPLVGTLQDNGFCTQSEQFDFLLDLDNRPVQPVDGKLYVPVFYSKNGTIKLGDTVVIHGTQFMVAGFIRDSLMNSALAYSKRFIVSEADYARLEPFGAMEYLIEYRLRDLSDLGRFSAAYSAAGLPDSGPTLTWPLFRMMSGLSDGMMIAVIFLVSILAVLIALLCIRFSLLAKIEEDYREIGVMKALGMRVSEIYRLYLANYGAIVAVGSAGGFLLALLLRRPMAVGIHLNLGDSGKDAFAFLLGMAGIFQLFLFILLYVGINLRRFRSISAVEAIRFGMGGQSARRLTPLRLSNSGGIPVNLLLGIQDVWVRKRLYGTMLAVVMLAAFIIIVPQNLYHTICAEDFVTYMGVGRCDLRMDIQQIGGTVEGVEMITAYMESDDAVTQYTVLNTKAFGVKLEDGTIENIKVELGDHTVFPVQCADGRMPVLEQEIALSFIHAEEWGKTVGDQIVLLTPDGEKPLIICGVYSDITNGGKTAKAVFSADSTRTAWSIVCIRLADKAQLDGKKMEYASRFAYAKISSIGDYVSQTFGQTLRSVRFAALISTLVAATITLLVTLLFLKLLVAKDRNSIAVMKALGFSSGDIKQQYIWRIISVLAIGVALGTLLAGIFGEKLATAVISSFGAASFSFVVNIPATYLLCPLILLLAALLAVAGGASSIGDVRISESIKE